MVDAVAALREGYAGVTGGCEMEEISDWPSTGFLDLESFLVGVFEPSFSFPFDPDFSFPFDFDLEPPDFYDLF
jgi:hypothetical protein